AVLVPTPVTRTEEVAEAPVVKPDLAAAVDWILGAPGRASRRVATAGLAPLAPRARCQANPRVLVARSDSLGDVLLAGPAIRAVAAGASHVTLLCGPRGLAAARLLPGVDDVVEWCVPWIDPQPPPIDRADVDALVKDLEATRFDEAVVFTSFHQSPLPLALLLRLAGVPRVAAISEDYPGALLDVRHRVPGDLPEAVRARLLATAAGFDLPPGDDGRLRLRTPLPDVTDLIPDRPYVVVHPGASVAARACPPPLCRDIVAALTAAGRRVAVTGWDAERELTAYASSGTCEREERAERAPQSRAKTGSASDLGGRTTMAELAAVLAGADALVVANTGPAHLAAAVGTPVVSLFAPTVPFARWAPYGVPVARLG